MLGNACSLCQHMGLSHLALPWHTQDHQSISELPCELIFSTFTLIPFSPPNHCLVPAVSKQSEHQEGFRQDWLCVFDGAFFLLAEILPHALVELCLVFFFIVDLL